MAKQVAVKIDFTEVFDRLDAAIDGLRAKLALMGEVAHAAYHALEEFGDEYSNPMERLRDALNMLEESGWTPSCHDVSDLEGHWTT